MAKSVLPFVKDQLPDFIRADHPQFQLFLDAYYEWMEQTNMGTSTSVKDVYKTLPNPGAIINQIPEFRDVDESLDRFLQYFLNELVPVVVDNNRVGDRFIIKKIRDLYLAKGTPNSFKLLFRMLYDREIDLFIPKSAILEASEGRFVSFTNVKVKVVEGESFLNDFTFNLSNIIIDDDTEALVVNAINIGFSSSNNIDGSLLQLVLNGEADMKIGQLYYIQDPQNARNILRVKVLAQIESIDFSGDSVNYRPRDFVTIRDTNNPINSTRLEIQSVTRGAVDGIFVRNRGENYAVGDVINFPTESVNGGTGAFGTITEVDRNGRIIAIDGQMLRTGPINTGYLSDDFEEATANLLTRGDYNVLPNVVYSTENGQGAQVFPTTTSIGRIKDINLLDSGVFEADSENDNNFFTIEVPLTFATIAETKFDIGSTIEFEYFNADDEAFQADSESIVFSIVNSSSVFYDTDANGLYILDSDTYASFDPSDSDGVAIEGTDLFLRDIRTYDSETGIYTYIVTRYTGPFGRQASSQVLLPIGLNDYGPRPTFDWISRFYTLGRNDSDRLLFNRWESDLLNTDPAMDWTITRESDLSDNYFLTSPRIDRLDEFHFNKLSRYNTVTTDTTVNFARVPYDVTAKSIRDFTQVGRFTGTGFGGKVFSTNAEGTQYTLIANTSSRTIDSEGPLQFPTPSDIDAFNNLENSIIRASQINPRTGIVQTEDDFPISANVSQYSRADIGQANLTISGVTQSQKRFISEDGFLNSASGGVLRDNNIYSEYSYIIQSDIEIEKWRDKIKETLHPAGMILNSELNIDTAADVNLAANPETDVFLETTNFTFDSTYDHYEDEPRGGIIKADNTVYEANPFNVFADIRADDGRANSILLTADSYQANTPIRILSQAGNAFWDYEPIGLVRTEQPWLDTEFAALYPYSVESETAGVITYKLHFDSDKALGRLPYFNSISTQEISETDSDRVDINVTVEYQYKDGTRQDLYKGNRNTSVTRGYEGLNIIQTSGFRSNDQVNNLYRWYDTELPVETYVRWNSPSNTLFKKIEYRTIAQFVGDSDRIYTTEYNRQEIDRNQELITLKYAEFNEAMREDQSLKFVEGTTTYYDYEAFDRRWHTINTLRDQDDGWYIQGRGIETQNINGGTDYRYHFALDAQPELSKVKTPLTLRQLGKVGNLDSDTYVRYLLERFDSEFDFDSSIIWREYYVNDFVAPAHINEDSRWDVDIKYSGRSGGRGELIDIRRTS